jgi:hypothetical protein
MKIQNLKIKNDSKSNNYNHKYSIFKYFKLEKC